MSTYTALLYSCGKGVLHREATEIYRHMRQSNLVPKVEVYTGVD
jgi:pentatricopeptide repeat protein